ncbi:MAG: hypothetical protein II871_06090 [Clostridia bacterium]|nr:hypothetical protein [Clostridia bacterium]
MMNYQKTDSPLYTRPSALIIFDKRKDTDTGMEQLCECERISASLRKHFSKAPIVSTAEEIWEELFREIPAIILIDLSMSSIDSLGLIRSLKSSKFCLDIRYFILCSRINDSVKSLCSQNAIDGAFSYDESPDTIAEQVFAKYTQMHPTSSDRRLRTISQMINDHSFLSDHRTVWELGSRITDALLVPLGFDVSHKGTKYLEFVICLRVFGAEKDMSKLYVLTAESYSTTPGAVEKSIRYSIEHAWSGSSPYMQYRMFGNTVDPERGKPTASEFVETIVRHTVERLSGVIDYKNF